jgi:hypothetical protein
MADAAQNYANHTRFRWMYHYTSLPILLVNAIVFIVAAVKVPTGMNIWMAVAFTALFMFAFDVRGQVITVQDRVIRDEMRMRLERVLGAGARDKIAKLSCAQMIGLRFASDAELAALVDRTLAGELPNRKTIKQAVQNWQADTLRA